MYIVFIYHDYKNKILNSICLFDKIKDILVWSKGLIKYNDVSKTSRVYITYKCYFDDVVRIVYYIKNGSW